MVDCDVPYCSGDDSLPFTCNECGGNYCSKHRLPEKHLCRKLRSTSKDVDELFSTGLQNKDDKKRGLTKRVDTRRSGSNQSKPEGANVPTSSEPPAHLDESDERDESDENSPKREVEDNALFDAIRHGIGVPHRRIESCRRTIRSAYRSARRTVGCRLRNWIAFGGVVLVLVGGVRLLANYPSDNQGLIHVVHRAEGLTRLFPEAGWVTYLVAGFAVFRLARYRTPKRSVGGSIKTASTVVLIGLLIAVLIVGFTPVSLSDETPGIIREPIQDSADFSADLVGNLTEDSTEEGPPTRPSTTTPDSRVSGDSATPASPGELDREQIERFVHEKVNERRQTNGLSPLEFDTELRDIARYHSHDMASKSYFSHDSPDGETMGDRYDKFGYDCRVSTGGNHYAGGGENIFRTEFSGLVYTNGEIADQTVENWMDSPGHRENILQAYWNNGGIGVNVSTSGNGTEIYVTQNFC